MFIFYNENELTINYAWFQQGQRHLGLDFTWDKDNGNLTWIDNWLWSTINLDQQLTWISNQLGSIIKLDQQSTLH